MLFRFRVCCHDDEADKAQGWVVASSEIHARELVGDFAFFQRMPHKEALSPPCGTIIVTEGNLE